MGADPGPGGTTEAQACGGGRGRPHKIRGEARAKAQPRNRPVCWRISGKPAGQGGPDTCFSPNESPLIRSGCQQRDAYLCHTPRVRLAGNQQRRPPCSWHVPLPSRPGDRVAVWWGEQGRIVSVPQELWADRRPECVQGGQARSPEKLIEPSVTRPRVRPGRSRSLLRKARLSLEQRPH